MDCTLGGAGPEDKPTSLQQQHHMASHIISNFFLAKSK
jgi:hypothetical protein